MRHTSPLTRLTRAAVTAALYVALTVTPPLSTISYGPIQFRVSEALCVLPFLFPETGIGLVLGCLIANLFTPYILPLDITLGTLATVIAVLFTLLLRKSRHRCAVWLAPLPTVLSNALIVPLIFCLSTPNESFGVTYLSSFLSVGAGEVVCAFGLGIPLCFILRKFFVSSHTR